MWNVGESTDIVGVKCTNMCWIDRERTTVILIYLLMTTGRDMGNESYSGMAGLSEPIINVIMNMQVDLLRPLIMYIHVREAHCNSLSLSLSPSLPPLCPSDYMYESDFVFLVIEGDVINATFTLTNPPPDGMFEFDFDVILNSQDGEAIGD